MTIGKIKRFFKKPVEEKPVPIIETRQNRRKSTTVLDVEVFTQFERFLLKIEDASIHGCRIALGNEQLQSGQFVKIVIASSRPIPAIVRWSSQGYAGLEFSRAVAPDEIADLLD